MKDYTPCFRTILLFCTVKKQKSVTGMRIFGIIFLVIYIPAVVFVLWCALCALIFHRMDWIPPFVRRWLERG